MAPRGTATYWTYHVLDLYLRWQVLETKVSLNTKQTLPNQSPIQKFDGFWRWMNKTRTDSDHGNPSLGTTPTRGMDKQAYSEDDLSQYEEEDHESLLVARVRQQVEEDAFTLFEERGYFEQHDDAWWLDEMSRVDGEWKAARKARRNASKFRRARGARVVEEESDEESNESEIDFDALDANDGGDEEVETGFDVPYVDSNLGVDDIDAFGPTQGIGGGASETRSGSSHDAEAMQFDESELTDEGIDDVSSDEEMYLRGSGKRHQVQRVDSYLEA